ncbi:MAG: hypothetical protein ACQEWM_01985 [Actinomycetota bacterium]
MERIANPMSAGVSSWASAPPPTRLMLVCRYAWPLWVAAGIFVWSARAEDQWPQWWMVASMTWMVGSWLLGAGANGSWWSGPFDAWHIGMGIVSTVLIVALGWSLLVDDRLISAFAAMATIGAVLGVAGLHAWRSMQRRRP